MQALESLTETQVSGCETKSSMGRGCRGPSRPHPVPSSPPLPAVPSGRGGSAEGGARGGRRHWVWGGPTLRPQPKQPRVVGGGCGGCGAVTQPRSSSRRWGGWDGGGGRGGGGCGHLPFSAGSSWLWEALSPLLDGDGGGEGLSAALLSLRRGYRRRAVWLCYGGVLCFGGGQFPGLCAHAAASCHRGGIYPQPRRPGSLFSVNSLLLFNSFLPLRTVHGWV